MNKYENEIIHFTGGINDYLGELDQGEHLNGPGWIRIKNPCILSQIEHGSQKQRTIIVVPSRIWGMGKMYQKFIDIKVPDESIQEFRVLDKDGTLYAAYIKEIERPDVQNIILPGMEDVMKVRKKQ